MYMGINEQMKYINHSPISEQAPVKIPLTQGEFAKLNDVRATSHGR